MNTICSCAPKALFHSQEQRSRKKGRHISLISHVLAAAYTWATPQKPLYAVREDRHDA